MVVSLPALRRAADDVVSVVRGDPAFARTSHLRVEVDGHVAYDRHLLGPVVADIFSITKSVLATLVGIAVADSLLSDLDAPLDDVLDAAGTPAAGLTWRNLLSMQRGADTSGPWDRTR